MRGDSFEVELDEQVVFDQLDHDENAIWSLLLATGYLRVERLERKGRLLHKYYTLELTNLEIESMFARMILGCFVILPWVCAGAGGGTGREIRGQFQ